MTKAELLVDGYERLRDAVYPAVNGLQVDELAYRPDSGANSIAWLAWHLTRLQDEAVAALAADRPRWTAGGWFDRFALPLEPHDTGFGHDPRRAALVIAPAGLLLDYFEDVHRRTIGWVRPLGDRALDRVVDGEEVPPATVEHRLVAVLVDDLQHVGQAAYLRGIVQRGMRP